jgi:hypothetical protein
VGPETPMSPCSKSTTHRLIQVPCLHRGYHAVFPPFLHPSPSIFSIFPPLFPPYSIITMPSLLPHRPSPPAAPVHSSLSFPAPFFYFFFFSLSAPAPSITHAVLPRSPHSSVPLPSPQFCFFFFFSFCFFSLVSACRLSPVIGRFIPLSSIPVPL